MTLAWIDMNFNTDGIVLRVRQTGEADRIVTVLTRGNGIIRAFANGAKRPKNTLHAGTQMLCYSNFSIFYNKDTYHINEAQAAEIFFGLRESVEKLSLAHYFCELAGVFSPEGEESEEQLRLILNTLHMLDKNKRPPLMLKAIMELRLMSLAGYMPGLVACEACGEHETPEMFFDAGEGKLYCEKCNTKPGADRLPLAVVSAMRHIVFSEINNLYNFSLGGNAYKLLSDVTERYMNSFINHKFSTLDFYNTL